MRERAYVWVDGPSGAGKTTLIEHVLKSNRSRLLSVARFVETDAVDHFVENSEGNEETKRFEDASVIASALFQYPPEENRAELDRFWDSEFILDYSEGIIFEGPATAVIPADLHVYVLRPLPEPEPIVHKESHEVARLSLDDIMSPAFLFGNTLKNEAALSALGRGKETPEQDLKQLMEAVRERILEDIDPEQRRRLEEGIPAIENKWHINPAWPRLAYAQTVVINIHDESERPAAELLASELRRIHADEEILHDLVGFRGGHHRISIFIANLSDSRDKALQKAIARMKRPLDQSIRSQKAHRGAWYEENM
ncbi:MAG TPA: hypothetical protein ENN80_04695 [Candidatus Hydrogenedentes bacterium]|nr:hypothetical protein [Candidatus Hydrogenedentota bacterium]